MRSRRRKELVEDIKLTLALCVMFIGVPMAMFLHWLAFGY